MRVVVISGYFNPIHTGHLDYIDNAAALGDNLVVIVNSDEQVSVKGSFPFMDQKARKRIVESIKNVDSAIISIDTDAYVVKTLEQIFLAYSNQESHFKEMIFANGGDRKKGIVPEADLCERLGITQKYGVGGEKTESSSNLINIHTSKIRGV